MSRMKVPCRDPFESEIEMRIRVYLLLVWRRVYVGWERFNSLKCRHVPMRVSSTVRMNIEL